MGGCASCTITFLKLWQLQQGLGQHVLLQQGLGQHVLLQHGLGQHGLGQHVLLQHGFGHSFTQGAQVGHSLLQQLGRGGHSLQHGLGHGQGLGSGQPQPQRSASAGTLNEAMSKSERNFFMMDSFLVMILMHDFCVHLFSHIDHTKKQYAPFF